MIRRLVAVAAAVAGWVALTRVSEQWGATAEEAVARFPGDEIVPHPHLSATRAVHLPAPPDEVFPWLVQMGSGRAGWYSYDRIDNAGRPSARRIHPEWQEVTAGDSLGSMAGVEFLVAGIDRPHSFVIRLPATSPIAFTLAYRLGATDTGTRLAARVRSRGPGWSGPLLRFLLGPADFVMMRRQLWGLEQRVRS